MKRYRVTLSFKAWEPRTVLFEAASEKEAERKALDALEEWETPTKVVVQEVGDSLRKTVR